MKEWGVGIKQVEALYVKLRSLNLTMGKEELLRDLEQGCDTMRQCFWNSVKGRLLEGGPAEIIPMARVGE